MREIELLRELRGDVPESDLAGAQSSLQTAIEEEIATPSGTPRRRFRMPAPPRLRVAALGVAVLLLGVLAAAVWLPADRGGPNTAAAALEDVAAVAGDQSPSAPPGDGQYLYTETISNLTLMQGASGGRTLGPDRAIREFWFGPSHSGREDTVSEVSLPGHEPQRVGFSQRYRNPFAYNDLSNLPTDPDVLERRIDEGKLPEDITPLASTFYGGPGPPPNTFDIARSLLNPQAYAPPRVREAIYEVMARQSGVELLGDVTDPVGRPGIGVADTSGGVRHELIFDPDTSALLAQRDVILDPKGESARVAVEPGTVSYKAFVSSGVADSLDETPRTNSLPPVRELPPGFPPLSSARGDPERLQR